MDRLERLQVQAFTLAAVAAVLADSRADTLEAALRIDPRRAEILHHGGLISARFTADGEFADASPLIIDDCLRRWWDEGRTPVSHAIVSALGQAARVAEGMPATGWAGQSDEVLIAQGEASRTTGHLIAREIVPRCEGLAARLADGGRILDLGTGIGALATALAIEFPAAEVLGIDISERPLVFARDRQSRLDPEVAGRIEFRQQDLADFDEVERYDLIWLPGPFFALPVLQRAIPALAKALLPGGWIVLGSNPAPSHPHRGAVDAWIATVGDGSTETAEASRARLQQAGFTRIWQTATVPGGPVLVSAQLR